MKSQFRAGYKGLAPLEDRSLIAGANVRLYTNDRGHTKPFQSATVRDMGFKLLQSVSRLVHGHFSFRSDGNNLTAIVKVTMGRIERKYHYPYRFYVSENPRQCCTRCTKWTWRVGFLPRGALPGCRSQSAPGSEDSRGVTSGETDSLNLGKKCALTVSSRLISIQSVCSLKIPRLMIFPPRSTRNPTSMWWCSSNHSESTTSTMCAVWWAWRLIVVTCYHDETQTTSRLSSTDVSRWTRAVPWL